MSSYPGVDNDSTEFLPLSQNQLGHLGQHGRISNRCQAAQKEATAAAAALVVLLIFCSDVIINVFVDPSTPPYSTTFLHISLPFSLFLSPSFSLSSFDFGSLLWQKRHYSLFGASVLDNGWWMRRGESGERSPWSVGRMLTKMAFVKKRPHSTSAEL